MRLFRREVKRMNHQMFFLVTLKKQKKHHVEHLVLKALVAYNHSEKKGETC